MGKLLILFVSGMIFLISIVLIMAGVLIATRIWMGKRRLLEHIIHPFPTVLTAELARSMKIQRTDDEFLIFNTGSLIRNFLLLVGGILSGLGILLIWLEKSDPYSELYWPPMSGGILASFLFFYTEY